MLPAYSIPAIDEGAHPARHGTGGQLLGICGAARGESQRPTRASHAIVADDPADRHPQAPMPCNYSATDWTT